MRCPDHLNPRQYAFLRKLRACPSGLPAKDFPSPAVLKRWLRRPRFRAALADLGTTLRLQRDLMLAGTAAHAAKIMQSVMNGPDTNGLDAGDIAPQALTTLQAMSKLVRLDQVRQKERRQFARRKRPAAGLQVAVNLRDGQNLLQQVRALAEPRPPRAKLIGDLDDGLGFATPQLPLEVDEGL